MVSEQADTRPVDVDVSIVSLGATRTLAACVRSLVDACAGISWRLTVVDNSPAGQDLDEVLRLAPAASTIRSSGRRGFAANHNLALRGVVAAGSARHVLVLNDDTVLDRDSVSRLVGLLDRDDAIGAAGPAIRSPTGEVEPTLLAWPSPTSEALRTVLPRLRRRSAAEGWLNGACILLRTAALRQVGLFDEAFFLFFEDTDLGRRLADAGWRMALCPDAEIVHVGHRTILAPGLRRDIEEQLLRSRYLYFRKHHGRRAAIVASELVRLALLARSAKMLAEGAVRADRAALAFSGLLAALCLSRPASPSRLELQARSATAA